MLIVFIVKYLIPIHTQQNRFFERVFLFTGISVICFLLASCGFFSTTYDITKGTVVGTYKTAKIATDITLGTCKVAYKIGKYTFQVVMAPLDWPMTHDIESIDGMSPKEAIEKGRVKKSPYVVKGKRYVPMSLDEAYRYSEVGVASWYGKETQKQKGGTMTANGEAFDPRKPTAAHKYLPLPMHVRVKNLENGRSMIVRVNDRGPFVGGRIIDLSSGAAKQLGFYRQGLAKVKIETVQLD
ncbi:MAG: septal ring lytic transglycosylase RlpA family protein [Thermodesulfobacteriota bacterium]